MGCFSKWKCAAFLCAFAVFPSAARAADGWVPKADVSCDLSNNSVDFGTVSRIADSQKRFPVNFTMTCNTNAYPRPYNKAEHKAEAAYCLWFETGQAQPYLGQGNNRILIDFYSDSFPNTPMRADISIQQWGTVATGYSKSPVPPRAGGPTYPVILNSSMTAKLELTNSDNLPGGRYSSNFSMRWYSNAAANSGQYPRPSVDNACMGWSGDMVVKQLYVSMTLKEACRVAVAKPIDFGAQAFLDKSVAADGQITVTCSKGAHYSVSINNGLHSGNARPRAMQRQNGVEKVFYDVYHDAAYSRPWTETDPAKGEADGSAKLLTVYARTEPNQGGKPAGAYSDTLVVTVRSDD